MRINADDRDAQQSAQRPTPGWCHAKPRAVASGLVFRFIQEPGG
jgi:hypothetical protein